ncbi:hypothetical protein Taro_035931, partial [Colocasia esculenta]|nr:hypothetical protein [Colocasia esculenta]
MASSIACEGSSDDFPFSTAERGLRSSSELMASLVASGRSLETSALPAVSGAASAISSWPSVARAISLAPRAASPTTVGTKVVADVSTTATILVGGRGATTTSFGGAGVSSVGVAPVVEAVVSLGTSLSGTSRRGEVPSPATGVSSLPSLLRAKVSAASPVVSCSAPPVLDAAVRATPYLRPSFGPGGAGTSSCFSTELFDPSLSMTSPSSVAILWATSGRAAEGIRGASCSAVPAALRF